MARLILTWPINVLPRYFVSERRWAAYDYSVRVIVNSGGGSGNDEFRDSVVHEEYLKAGVRRLATETLNCVLTVEASTDVRDRTVETKADSSSTWLGHSWDGTCLSPWLSFLGTDCRGM